MGPETGNAKRPENGLTGQLNILTPGEQQQAYDKHTVESPSKGSAPTGDFERALAQSVADDLWRLKRARTIESSTFALGMRRSEGQQHRRPEVDGSPRR